MNKSQEKLLAEIKGKGRLLTVEEKVQFYAENVQKKYCAMTLDVDWKKTNETGFTHWKEGSYALKWYDLVSRADSFYKRALGRFVVDGQLKVNFE